MRRSDISREGLDNNVREARRRDLIRWAFLIVGAAPYLFGLSVLLNASALGFERLSAYLLQRVMLIVHGDHSQAPLSIHIFNHHFAFSFQIFHRPLPPVALLFFVVSIVTIAAKWGSRWISIHADGVMLKRLQQRLYDSLLAQPTAYHASNDLGETIVIVTQDAPTCQSSLSKLIELPITQGIAFALSILFLTYSVVDLRRASNATLYMLFGLVTALVTTSLWLSMRPARASDEQRQAQANVSNKLIDAATPLQIQLMGAERQQSLAFGMALSEATETRVRALKQTATAVQFQLGAPEFVTALILTGLTVIATGDPRAASSLFGIYYFLPKLIEPINVGVQIVGSLKVTWIRAARMGRVLDNPPPPTQPPPGLSDKPPEIRLERISYTYTGASLPTLSDLSAVFPAGKISAVVGRSGSGKSTLLWLLMGVGQPEDGTISLGSYPIQGLGLRSLRGVMAMVPQSPMFISDTVRANFLLARESATDAEIEAVARHCGLWPALVKLGGDRPLEVFVPRDAKDGGLSGGERRLLSVARMLLRRPQILLLDEPTANVDDISIELLVKALRRVARQGLTIIVVEHNLGVVRALADEVFCLSSGRISEFGSPEELALRPSLFRDLLAVQDRLTSTNGMSLTSVRMPNLLTSLSMNGVDAAAVAGRGSGSQAALAIDENSTGV
jgi:ABC-type multidrug transport system fused ATPase/permease subunit